MVDRYYHQDDPRDREWWARSTDVERTCVICGDVVWVPEHLAQLPYFSCERCVPRIVDWLVDEET